MGIERADVWANDFSRRIVDGFHVWIGPHTLHVFVKPRFSVKYDYFRD